MYYYSLLKIYLFSLQREYQYKLFAYLDKEFSYVPKKVLLIISKISSAISIFSILGSIFILFILPLNLKYMTFILYYFYFMFSIFKYQKENILNKYFFRWVYEIHLLHFMIPLCLLSLLLLVDSLGLSIFLILIAPLVIKHNIKRIIISFFYFSLLLFYLFFPEFRLEKLILLIFIYFENKLINSFLLKKFDIQKIYLYQLICKDSYQYLNQKTILISNFIILLSSVLLDMLKIDTSIIFFILCTISIAIFVIVKKSSQLNNKSSLFITGFDFLNTNLYDRLFYRVLFDFILYIPIVSTIFIFLLFNNNNESFLFFLLFIITLLLVMVHSNTIGNALINIRSIVDRKSVDDYTSITLADSLLIFMLIVLLQLSFFKITNANVFLQSKYSLAISEFIILLLYWGVACVSILINILNFKQTRKR